LQQLACTGHAGVRVLFDAFFLVRRKFAVIVERKEF
jgi:hypothetical protein